MADQYDEPRACEWCGAPPAGIKTLDPGEVKEQVRNGEVYRTVIRLPIRAWACQSHMEAKAGPAPHMVLRKGRIRDHDQGLLFEIPKVPKEQRRSSGLLDG